MTDEATGEKPKPRIPAWAWLFVAACVAIPVITLGGAIPGAIGGGGAFGCVAIARDTSKPVGVRLGLCIAVTVVCWTLLLGLVIVAAIMQLWSA